MPPAPRPVTAAQVRRDFNDLRAVMHYAKAAHELGLWASERILIERHFPDRAAPLLEAGCGAGRVCVALHGLGYQNLTAFDFAQELVDQALALAAERRAPITIHHADATKLTTHPAFGGTLKDEGGDKKKDEGGNLKPEDPDHRMRKPATSAPASHLSPKVPSLIPQPSNFSSQLSALSPQPSFRGCLFMFNGLMQIPLRRNRRRALRQLAAVCAPGAPLLFTTHDRDHSPLERASWRLEFRRWAEGKQDPRLREYGDRRFEDECGDTFMHLPDRAEILGDLASTGWIHVEDHLRRELAKESAAVREFSDECRFWVARRA